MVFAATAFLIVLLVVLKVAEWFSDQPMPDDLKLWFISMIGLGWLLHCAVNDIRRSLKER